MVSTTEQKAPNAVEMEAEEGDTEVIPGSLLIKADGRVIRSIARVPPSSNFVDGVASKDVAIDPGTGVWARLFVPEIVTTDLTRKLPVVVFFHGGGFCMGDAGGDCFLLTSFNVMMSIVGMILENCVPCIHIVYWETCMLTDTWLGRLSRACSPPACFSWMRIAVIDLFAAAIPVIQQPCTSDVALRKRPR